MAKVRVSSKTEMGMVIELGRSPLPLLAPRAGALLALVVVAGAASSFGCSSTSLPVALAAHPVAPAPPPKDDGKPSQGGPGGDAHSAALEQLRVAPTGPKTDKQHSIVVPLPDAPNWTRVRFLTVPGLVGFRYGKSHHAIVAGFVTHVDDNTVEGACTKSFEAWAMPWVEAFDVDLHHDAPAAFPWTMPSTSAPRLGHGAVAAQGAGAGALASSSSVPKKIAILDADPLTAKTATILSHETYSAAWVAYPAWDKACLIVGVAIPTRDDATRARDVRDRFVQEVFPKVVVIAPAEPKERY